MPRRLRSRRPPAASSPKLTVGGTEVEPGEPVEVPLAGGAPSDAELITTVPVVVTAEDGTQRTYTVSLSRTNPTQISALRDLSVEGYELTPAFDPERKGAENPYQIAEELDSSVASVDLSWALGWEGQQVFVNGGPATGSATVALHDGENVIEVGADSYAGDSGTYVIKLNRATAAPSLDVTVVVSAKCMVGKVVLTAKVTNGEGIPVSVTLASPYGTTTLNPAAGKSLSQAYTTRLAQIPAGTMTVTSTATVDGQQVQTVQTVAIAAAGC